MAIASKMLSICKFNIAHFQGHYDQGKKYKGNWQKYTTKNAQRKKDLWYKN